MARWFAYTNDDLYRSYNVVFGDISHPSTWTECVECQTLKQAENLATILNTMRAGPYMMIAATQAGWQEARQGNPVPREHPGDSTKRSSIY